MRLSHIQLLRQQLPMRHADPREFASLQLGPSTIVGSAAFNLLMILAICVTALPEGETRKISQLGVYACTASASVLAYMWLVVILGVTSPDVIEPWEGMVNDATPHSEVPHRLRATTRPGGHLSLGHAAEGSPTSIAPDAHRSSLNCVARR